MADVSQAQGGFEVVNYEVLSYQLPAARVFSLTHYLSAISYQLSVLSFQLPVARVFSLTHYLSVISI